VKTEEPLATNSSESYEFVAFFVLLDSVTDSDKGTACYELVRISRIGEVFVPTVKSFVLSV